MGSEEPYRCRMRAVSRLLESLSHDHGGHISMVDRSLAQNTHAVYANSS